MNNHTNWWAAKTEPRGFTCRTRTFSLRDIATMDIKAALTSFTFDADQLSDASAERLHYELRNSLGKAGRAGMDHGWPTSEYFNEIHTYAEECQLYAERHPRIVNDAIRKAYQKDIKSISENLQNPLLLDHLSDDELVRLCKEVEWAEFI